MSLVKKFEATLCGGCHDIDTHVLNILIAMHPAASPLYDALLSTDPSALGRDGLPLVPRIYISQEPLLG